VSSVLLQQFAVSAAVAESWHIWLIVAAAVIVLNQLIQIFQHFQRDKKPASPAGVPLPPQTSAPAAPSASVTPAGEEELIAVIAAAIAAAECEQPGLRFRVVSYSRVK